MALKECIATGIRNINNFCDGNVFKACNMKVLPLLQKKIVRTNQHWSKGILQGSF
jgi:hypothetical protein